MIAAAYNYTIAISNWWRLIWLSMGQVMNQYSRGSRLSFLLALAEPLFMIGAMYIIRGLFRDRTPHFGTSLFLFYATGLLPYYLFLRLSSRTRSAATGPRMRLPGVSALDIYIASILVNALVWIAMIVTIFVGMGFAGIKHAWPDSIVTSATPMALLIVLGTGVGMINNVINRYFSLWNQIYAILTRGLAFLSGTFLVVDTQPPWLRAWSIANPVSHGVEWFRLGVYGHYPHASLDPVYLIQCALVAVFLGMVLDRAALRSLDKA